MAKVTSVSVITPILDKIILGATSSCFIFSTAVFIASLDPWTSDFIIIASSFTKTFSVNADSLLTDISGACFDLLLSNL